LTGSILVVSDELEQATTPVRMSAAPNWEITFLFIMTPYIWKEVFGKRNFFSLPEGF
jgi:hypothetical protein